MVSLEPVSPAQLETRSLEANEKAKEEFMKQLPEEWLRDEVVTQGSLALAEV